ncbi:MAG: bifunctional aspartate kinase/diaminopimelate decarboxylase, partial [Gammaproteobacteria bacterium]|nr:bifunctional aspartate kinase/diaminopimelate decarboxylase [Gammaproteobacteria bacterium]
MARNKRAGGQQQPPWVVLKFGGTSVSTVERWATIRDLVRQRQAEGYRPVVVHSALATVSNRLEELLRLPAAREPSAALGELRTLHLKLADAMGVGGEAALSGYFAELEQLVAGIQLVGEVSPRVHARIMAMGELMATRLGADYLKAQGLPVTWLDARELLRSLPAPGN